MADKVFQGKVLNVCKTTEQWAAVDSVISKGLLCVEFTTDGKTKVKMGDGAKAWATLPYITDGTFDIADYYTSEQTDTAIDNKIATLGTIIRIKGVKASFDELPAEGNIVGDLWFVGTLSGESQDSYSEYIWTTDNKWEFIGKSAGGDLSEYAKITYVDGKIEEVTNRLTAVEEKLQDVDFSKFVTTDDTVTINCQL